MAVRSATPTRSKATSPRTSRKTTPVATDPTMQLEGLATITYETITPQRASQLLMKMGGNRRYRPRLAAD